MVLKADIRRRSYDDFAQQKNHSQRQQNKTAFKGFVDGWAATMNVIDTVDLINYGGVDLLSMVTPRTAIDTKKRGPQAGFETFCREIAGTVFNCLIPGFWAFGLATILGKLNKVNNNPIKANMWANGATIDGLHSIFKKAVTDNGGIIPKESEKARALTKASVEAVFNNMSISTMEGTRKLDPNSKEFKDCTETMTDIIHNDKIGHKELKKALDSVENTIGYALGGRDDVSVVFKNKEGENDVLSSSLKLLLRDTHDISKHYFRQFTDLNHIDTALDKLKHINTAKTVFAMTIACATCFSAQPIIRKITKKMTGKDEFPVYDNVRKQYEQKSDKAATPSFKGKTSVLRKLGLEFNDKFPNVRHFALVFVVQAMGRLFAARDKNEFRETFTRDSLGGINWLILGGLMGKLIIRYSKYKDKLWKAPAREEGQSAFKTLKNFLFKSKVVSYKELNDMKEYALRHPEGKTEPEINKLFHALKLRKCIASSVGILWPCIALGVLIPLYNIHRTNKVEAKKLAGEGFVEKPEYKNKKPAFSAATSNTGVFNKFTQKMGKA